MHSFKKRSESVERAKSNIKARLVSQEVKELRESLHYVEVYYAQAKLDYDKISHELKTSQTTCQELQKKLAKQAKINEVLNKELLERNQQVETSQKQIQSLKKEFSKSQQEWEVKCNQLQAELSRNQECLKMAQEDTLAYMQSKKANKAKLKQIALNLDCQEEGEYTNRSSKKIQEEINSIPYLRKELMMLQKDNKRLVDSIKEGKDLSEIKGMPPSVGVRYIGEGNKCKKMTCASNSRSIKWVPAKAFNTLNSQTYDSPLLQNCLRKLLVDVNATWQSKETSRIKELKENYDKKIKLIKKKLNSSRNSTPNSMRKTKRFGNTISTNRQNNLREFISAKYEEAVDGLSKVFRDYFASQEHDDSQTISLESFFGSVQELLEEYTDQLVQIIPNIKGP